MLHSALYIVIGIGYRLFPFLILPWITATLSVDQFAILGLYLTFVAVGSTVVGLKPDVYLIIKSGEEENLRSFWERGRLQGGLYYCACNVDTRLAGKRRHS